MQRCLMVFVVNAMLLNSVLAADEENPAALTAEDVEKAVTFLNNGVNESKNGAVKRELRKLLALIETPDSKTRVDLRVLPAINVDHPVEGQIGAVRTASWNVVQVISENEMLVAPIQTRTSISPGDGLKYRQTFRQVEGKPLKLCASTKGLVDGEKLKEGLSGVFIATGTETYPTLDGGTNTVWVLKRFDIEKASAALKAGQKKAPASKDGDKPKKP